MEIEKIEEKLKWINEKIEERFGEKEKIEKGSEIPEERIKELKELIAKIEIKKEDEKEIEKEAKELKEYPVKEKVKRILILAATKNLRVAIETAKKLEDDLVLDLIHDILAENKNYRKFL
ncbi:MAG: hypothetical protein QXO12_03055 [Candidatus Pacearchaeota archaeon]